MENILSLKCLVCGSQYRSGEVDYVCPNHGDEGVLDVQYDYDFIGRQIDREILSRSKDFSIWRYKPMLPVHPGTRVPPLAVGWTPLYAANRLASDLGLKTVWVKDDGLLPTASLKDRASAVAVAKALEKNAPIITTASTANRLASDLGLKTVWVKDDGLLPTASLKDRASAIAVVKALEKNAPIITTASTGNAAAALSGLCAGVGQPNVIFVPENAPQAKIAQLLVFGSRVVLVKGSYDEAFELCLAASKTYGWYNRNSGYNPYMTEGKKTVAYEICEQLDWNAPDRIFVSVGDGCIIGGLHKGLKDLFALGWIDKMPKLMGAQAEGSSYMYAAWKNGEDILTKPPVVARTVADSISTGLPRDRIKALAAVTETDGAFICLSDEEILNAIPALARSSGVFAEPAGAAAYAGLVKMVKMGSISGDENIVVLNTGNGLKDVAGAMQAVELAGTRTYRVRPDLAELEKVAAGWGDN